MLPRLFFTLLFLLLFACSTPRTYVDADGIESALSAHRKDFRTCYTKEHTDKSGLVRAEFVIGPDGKVTQASVEKTSLHEPGVEACILSMIQQIQFSVPPGAGPVRVQYPFDFHAASK